MESAQDRLSEIKLHRSQEKSIEKLKLLWLSHSS